MSKGIKVLATIGPSSANMDAIKGMIRYGASGFRINMSFGDADTWNTYIDYVRGAASEFDAVISLMGDVPGPQIRSGDFKPFNVQKGEIVTFRGASRPGASTAEVPVSRRELFEVLEPGDTILYGDGDVELRVIEAGGDYANCIVTAPGTFIPGKKVVVLGKEVPLPFLDEKQLALVKYICEKKFTYIALSYVRNEQDVLLVKDLLNQYGCSDVGIISKIETPSGVKNAERVSKVSDAVLIARGDLGVHFPIETVPILQEQITKLATELGKPVIIATDILESMIESGRPSRSDVVGIYNVVYSLADAVLLTNETAVGKHPVEAVKWARIVADTAFENMPGVLTDQLRKHIKPQSLLEKYVHGLVSFAESLEGSIIAYTKTGRTVPLISRLRPRVPVYVGSWNRRLLEKYTVYYNVHPIDVSMQLTETDDYEKGVQELYLKARSKGYLRPGEVIVKSYVKPGLNVHEIRVEIIM
ncbi:MAG: pyruvate kinase [Desulfurococcaceae archaeon]